VLLGKYNEEALTALSLNAFLTLLENRQGAIDLALDKNRKNPHTAAVEDCDEKRDDALLAFKYFIQYCAKQPDLSIRQAAELLIGALQTFGWSMQNESNSEQSKQVKSFIAEVDNQSQLSTALTTCNCNEQYELIKSTQADFDTELEKFNAAEATIKTIDPLEEKAFIRETVENMLFEIEYQMRKGTYNEVITINAEINALLEGLYATIKARYTRAQNNVETETE